ncbi:glycosyltransferase [Deinococcus sp. VB142]|uniref:Glycosyltransferase n=1 Tax=Deinococcus sp. VB142 TaxID=3112952 RepID=A0AAU6PZ81_9DEIO
MKRLSKSNLGIVVVCYDTGADFIQRLSKYIVVSNNVILVINKFSSFKKQQDLIHSVAEVFHSNISDGSLRIEELPDNLGIAAAMNHGIRQLMDKCEWVLFFDDDTMLNCQNVDELSDELNGAITYIGDRKLGIFALGYHADDSQVDSRHDKDAGATHYIEKYAVISSGSIIAVDTFKKFGLFEEGYFIDSVDVEYALRLKAGKFAIVQSSKPLMIHPIGRRYEINLLGKKILFSEHNSIRCYYIGRNRIAVGIKYMKQFPEIFLYSQLQTLFHIGRIVAFEDKKLVKIIRMLRGVAHGLTGKSGKLIPGGSK